MSPSSDDTTRGESRLRQTADAAKRAAGETLHQAHEQLDGTFESARRRAKAEAERGKNRGAEEIHSWASALERASEELGRESPQGRLVNSAAGRLDEVARSIEERSIGEMMGGVAAFGRRNPALFAGAALLAGFACSRFATAHKPPGIHRQENPS